MTRPTILDAYCCAGGAARGYQRAGFYVVGVDKDPQPNYCGDEFIQADAVAFIATRGREFDAIHTSPPCQSSSALTKGNRKRKGWTDNHVDLIPVTRALLDYIGRPSVIENVQGSQLRRDLTLCGEMFDLDVIRHRYFELGRWTMPKPQHVKHRGLVAGWRHGKYVERGPGAPYFAVYGDGGGKGTVAEWQAAMGIDWTDVREEIAEAIPPAYAQHIGAHLLVELAKREPSEVAA